MYWGYYRKNRNVELVDTVKLNFKVSCSLRVDVSNNIYADMLNAIHFAFTYLVLLILLNNPVFKY